MALPSRRRAGTTLLELLVVIAVIGVLVSLTLSGVQKVRAAAARTRCQNNLRQLGLALHHYHNNQNVLPAGVRDPASGRAYSTWCQRLLPYVEQQALWDGALSAYQTDPSPFHNPPHAGLSTVLLVFACPADGRTAAPQDTRGYHVALTSYLGVGGLDAARQDGTLYMESNVRFTDITDGLSQTLMVGERPPSADMYFGWWYAGRGQNNNGSADSVLGVREWNVSAQVSECPPGPYQFQPGRVDAMCDMFHFWSLHSGGANFLFGDGSVRFLSYSVNGLLPALATRAGGEAVSAE